MRAPSTSRALAAIVLALVLGATASQARTLDLRVARLQAPGLEVAGLQVGVVEEAGGTSLRVEAARLVVAQLRYDGRLAWTCTLAAQTGARTCSGPLAWRGADGRRLDASLTAHLERDRLALTLAQEDRRIAVSLPFAGTGAVRAELQQVPASWLAAPLAAAWPDGRLRAGSLDARISRAPEGQAGGDFSVSGLNLGTRDDAFGGRGLAASGRFTWIPQDHGMALAVDARLTGGTLHAGTRRLVLPATPVGVTLAAHTAGDGRWQVGHLGWRDPGALTLAASGKVDVAARVPLGALRVELSEARFPLAWQRYLADLPELQALGGLSLEGGLAGTLALERHGLRKLVVHLDRFSIADAARGVAVDALTGAIDWQAQGTAAVTTLRWAGITLPGLALPSAQSRWQARDGILHLAGSLDIALPAGEIDLRALRLDPALRGDWLAGAFSVRDFGYQNATGTVAIAGLSVDGTLRLSGEPAAPHVAARASLLGGEALAGAVYVKLPPRHVEAALELALGAEAWDVREFQWRDPGVLAVTARGRIAPGAAQPLASLQLDVDAADLGAAIERYGKTWLAARGWRELAADGAVSGQLEFDAHGLQRFSFSARDAGLHDLDGRISLAGLDGSVDWRVRGAAEPTQLAWDALELFRIPFGPARARLHSVRGALQLVEPLDVEVLGGKLRLEKLSLLPRSVRGERYAASFAVIGVDMARLSAALGWPRFGGNLSGGIPEIELVGDTIELHGGLDLYVFDGHVGVSGLTLERPFGVAPSLGADIHFENLDLERVTNAFSFGNMSGRLMGSIRGLRLVDWSPVAFDAWLRTRGGGRMSYTAVDDISAMGGGGLGANLQTMALQLFDSFGYRRLGIRCKLRDEVCRMGGIEPVPATDGSDGYTIVEGAGLPRISIVGHHRRVDWPTLVRRLREATEGEGPVVR